MEKKKAPAKPKAAKEAPKKKAAKPSGASAAKKSAKGKKVEPGIRKEEAAKRDVQEEGSIAPPTGNLVSAFALFKSRKVPVRAPTVARVAAGGSLPKPPAPPAPAAPVPAAPAAAVSASAAAPAAPAKPAPVEKRPDRPQTVLPTAVGAGEAAKPAIPVFKQPEASVQAPARPAAPPPPRPAAPPPAPTHAKPAPQHARTHAPAPAKAAAPSAPPKPAEAKPSEAKPAQPLKKLQVSTMVTVRELAEKMELKPNDLIKKLMSLGVFATINQRLETEAASIIAQDFGFELEVLSMYKEDELQTKAGVTEKPENLKPRPPVVTVMGHVDHGKTSLLDAIRQTKVAEGESGGITQHIGAYRVTTPKGDIVFLDTPGHEAFTAMRARGTKVTDIVVLVVSATDGVMPQTIEAIDHAKAANVPIIVAVNKIDLPGANPQKIRQELSNHGVMSEEWGGKTIFVEVSAKKRLNLDNLLEMISLQAEILDIKANPDRPGFGVVLEAKMDPKRGSVATLLIQAGTVKVGDAFVAGLSYGKIKALLSDRGQRLETAGPATPVEVLGIMGTPQAGDVFSVVSDERQAREIAEKRRVIHREQQISHQRHMTLVGLRGQLSDAAVAKDLNLLLKADVQGSLQALKDSLEGMSTSECRVRIIHSGVGNANESDILLASASDAVTMLFRADIDARAEELATREGVEVRKYDVIYDLIGDVKAALEGLLEPEIVDVIVGKAEVKQVFAVKNKKIAGSIIRDGKATRGAFVRLVRGGAVVHQGKIVTLRRFKDDVKEVEKGLDCGIGIEGFDDYAVGDALEVVVKESRTRRLNESKQ